MALTERFSNFASPLASALKRYDEAMRTGAKAEVIAQLAGEILPLLAQLAQSPLAREVGEALHGRVRGVLDQLSGEPLLTVLVAEYLRGQIHALEASARKLIEVSQGTIHHATYSRRGQTPDVLLATAIVEKMGILGSKLRTVQDECASLPLIIPASLDTLAARMQIAGGLVAAAAPAVAGPGTVLVVPAASAESASYRYWTHHGKAQDLRREAHRFGEHLLASLKGLRDEIDGAQCAGWYHPATLRAVADSLCTLAANALSRGDALVARANAAVAFWD